MPLVLCRAGPDGQPNQLCVLTLLVAGATLSTTYWIYWIPEPDTFVVVVETRETAGETDPDSLQVL